MLIRGSPFTADPGGRFTGGQCLGSHGTTEAVSYDLPLVRINSSSGITHPWKDGTIPEEWAEVVVGRLQQLNQEIDA